MYISGMKEVGVDKRKGAKLRLQGGNVDNGCVRMAARACRHLLLGAIPQLAPDHSFPPHPEVSKLVAHGQHNTHDDIFSSGLTPTLISLAPKLPSSPSLLGSFL